MALKIKKKGRVACATLYGYVYWTKANDGETRFGDACIGCACGSDGVCTSGTTKDNGRRKQDRQKKGTGNKRAASPQSQEPCKQTKSER